MASIISMDACGELVEKVGTPRFARALMRAGHEVVQADYCSLFAFGSDDGPICLASCGTETDHEALETSRRYADRHWRTDPLMIGQAVPTGGSLYRGLNVSVNDAYRWDCFDRLNIGDRLVLLFDDEVSRLRLGFYRLRERAAFCDDDVERVLNAGSLFFKATRRHFDLAAFAASNAISGQLSAPMLESRVRRLGGDLSPREVEVCSRILAGMTAEGIALDLTIGINSVVTYRKRAYAKLGIATQNELFARCLAAC